MVDWNLTVRAPSNLEVFMPTSQPVGRNTIRIFQTHNAAGEPVSAEFTQVITHHTVNTLGSDTMEFLAPLSPRQTKDAGVFTYTDPARGSGWMRLEGFLRSDAERIQELVRMAEITSVVGPEPHRNADLRYGNALVLRSNNPWVLIVFGAVMLGLAVMLLSRAGEVEQSVGYLVMGGLFVVLAVLLLVRAGSRLPWWTRARRAARENGGDLPSDLQGW